MRKAFIFLMMLCLLPAMGLADHEEKFLAEGQDVIATPDLYRSQTVSVEITRMRVDNSDVYVADVYVKSTESLRRGFGKGEWGKGTQRIRDIAADNGAIVALTGDSSQNFTSGWVVGNGEIFRSTRNSKRDLCLILRNGEWVSIQSQDNDQEALKAMSSDIWQTFLFGPILLDENGKALTDFSESNVRRANPRSAIGYYEPGHYCLVQVDGRGTVSALSETPAKNTGMTLTQLAALVESLGCSAAYNLDGGQSAAMWFQGEIISTPYRGGRGIGDAVLVADCGQEMSWQVED